MMTSYHRETLRLFNHVHANLPAAHVTLILFLML